MVSDLLPMAKARGIPPLERTPNALPAPQAPAYLPMAKARGITQDLVNGAAMASPTIPISPASSRTKSSKRRASVQRNNSPSLKADWPNGAKASSGSCLSLDLS
jgi:hypothetical protein